AENRDDWAGAATASERALAADPTNLEAAWLAAVAYGKTGKQDRVTAPLVLAGLGDFGKWGLASLEQPGLRPYLETDAGKAWRAEVEASRARYVAAIRRSTRVIASGDVYAIDGGRWYRLTHTFGTVVAAYTADETHLAYVTRGRKSGRRGVGFIDLSTGITGKPQPIGEGPAQLSWSETANGFYLAQGATKKLLTLAEGPAQGTFVATAIVTRPSGPWLEIYPTSGTRLHRTAPNIAADWDERGLASAMRITTSNRTVTLPGQIVGDSIAWSPDKNHLVAVVALEHPCSAAAYTIDATTGAQAEVAHGTRGLAIEWIGNRALAVGFDDQVQVASLDGGSTPVTGAVALARPRFTPKCAPAEPDAPTPEPDESDDTQPEN
ncbi:MAG TPA: hypothetical protein VGC41_18420, partial [Kofleriaceae bacterium]